jgi:superfamily I DNA/RNA helicase
MIASLLSEDGPKILRAFVDANQALYAVPKGLTELLDAQPIQLRHNLRNTKAIARVTEPLYSGPLIIPVGPDGERPAERTGTVPESCAAAAELAVHFIRGERLAADDIAILAPVEQHARCVRSILDQLRIAHCTAAARKNDCVTIDTIRRFKGLEAAVVILLVDGASAQSRELAYVGVSRAQSRLYVLGETRGTLLGRALAAGLPGPA